MNSVYNAMINVYILGALLAIAVILLVVFAKKRKQINFDENLTKK